MTDRATFSEAQRALNELCDEVLRQIPTRHVQLSLPVDGAGVRIRASVDADEVSKVPDRIEIELSGRVVEIPIEAIGDYEPTKAQ